MNVGSLFSGAGGLDLGLARAGFTHRFFCESDPYRRRVLARHWPGVPIYEDVTEVAGMDSPRGTLNGDDGERECGGGVSDRHDTEPRHDWRLRHEPGRELDLLAGGFPCQDLSVAGKRGGLAGARSGLFFEFARILDALQPEWLLVENVPGLLSSNGGRDFGELLGTLADLGYGVAWRILNSRFFGVPQRRRRVFIVGNIAGGSAGAQRAGEVLSVGSGCPRHSQKGGEAGQRVAASLSKGSSSPGTSYPGRRQEDDENLVPEITRTLQGGASRGNDEEAGYGPLIPERERETVNALDRMQGGADDNSAQAGHLIAEQ